MTRFYYIKHDEALPSDEAIYELFRRYPELPSHFAVKLLRRDYATCNNRIAQLTEQGHLLRHKPNSRISKHYSYSLNRSGKDTTQRAHRLAETMVKASTEIGAREAGIEFIPWHELAQALPAETLRDYIDAGKDVHLVPLNDPRDTTAADKTKVGHVHPDGDPFSLYNAATDDHVNIIDEVDLDTEPLVSTKPRRAILEKYEHYNKFFDRKIYASHYGWKNCILRIFTTNPTRRDNMIRLYKDKFGPCKHIIFGVYKNYFKEASYPPADGTVLTTPYKRVGHSDYRLDRFWEMN